MLKLVRPIALVVPCLSLMALGCGSTNFDDNTPPLGDTGPAGDTGFNADVSLDGGDGGIAFAGLELDPANSIIYIDTTTTPVTKGTQAYKAILHNDDGTSKDVTATATFTVDDPALGTFAGPLFTTVDNLPGGKLGASTVVHVTEGTKSGAGNLTIVQIRKTGDKKDFFFVVPYMGPPDPSRDVLKFSTTIKQVDVGIVMDCTGSMGGSLTNLKTNVSTTLFPNLVKAIPSVGMAVIYHDDYPYGSYGSPKCGATTPPGDLPVGILQVVTTDLTKAQAGANALALHCGADGPESQIPAMYHTLTGDQLDWPGGSVAKHTPAAGTFGGVDFRPGSLPVVVEITDVDWHGTGHTPYSFKAPDMPELKKAFNDNNARFVDVTNGAWSASEVQADELSDATKSNIPPAAFGGTCTTGISGAARPATGPGGTCRLNFLHNNGAGVSDSIVKAIQAISVGTVFDVTAKPSNDPTNPGGVDATQFIKALRAMEEGDAANGCPAGTAKDTDGDTVNDTFTAVKVGTPVCFEVLPKMNTTVPPTGVAQFFNAFIDVLGMPGAIKLDRRVVVFLVPPKAIAAK